MSAKHRNCFWNDENRNGEDSSLLSSHISGGEIYSRFMGRLWVLRILGCSQQEGVATCLLSVLLQPSCGPTLVDFSEITWHPYCAWLRGGSASAGLCYGQHGPPSPCWLYPLPLLKKIKKRWVGLMFEHIKHIHKHFKCVSRQFFHFAFCIDSILRTNPCLLNHIFVYPDSLCLYTHIISNKSRPPPEGFVIK